MKDLKTKLFEGIGAASMCWSETPKGEFDSTRAKGIADDIWSDIENLQAQIKTLEIILKATDNFAEALKQAAKYDPVAVGNDLPNNPRL